MIKDSVVTGITVGAASVLGALLSPSDSETSERLKQFGLSWLAASNGAKTYDPFDFSNTTAESLITAASAIVPFLLDSDLKRRTVSQQFVVASSVATVAAFIKRAIFTKPSDKQLIKLSSKAVPLI